MDVAGVAAGMTVTEIRAGQGRSVVHLADRAGPQGKVYTENIVADALRHLAERWGESYGEQFQERLQAIGIKEVRTTPRSPWQNPFCERLIGSIRRDCLNQVIILGESPLRRILGRYFHYYHKCRTHLSLEKDAPELRPIQEVSLGEVIEIPEVGGLHHHYERRAA
jgi:putative transposase